MERERELTAGGQRKEKKGAESMKYVASGKGKKKGEPSSI